MEISYRNLNLDLYTGYKNESIRFSTREEKEEMVINSITYILIFATNVEKQSIHK